MNLKITPYVNFLLDRDLSPFCEYIVYRELYRSDAETVYGAYEWATRFKLYDELRDEQLPDGSWGGFDSAVTAQSKGRHFKTTGTALLRIFDLSLDTYDPMVNLTVRLLKKYLSDETLLPDTCGKHNTVQPVLLRRSVIRCLSRFEPDNGYVAALRADTAARLEKSCAGGSFDPDAWRRADADPILADFSMPTLLMLSAGGAISDGLQHMLMAYCWNNKRKFFGDVTPEALMKPDEPMFHFWLRCLEDLRDFSLFPEFMADKVAPHLFSICDRLCDGDDSIQIFVNRYHYHYGQYSAAWNKPIYKKRDLLLRIIRTLDKC